MAIYLIGLLLSIICAILPSFIKTKSKLITIICLIVPLFYMWFICTFKGNSIGSDTPTYIESYNGAYEVSSIKEARDVGYGIFQFICARLHLPWVVFLGLCNLSVFVGTALFAYKKTFYPSFLPFFIYTFLIFEFALSGLRQSIAIGLLFAGMAFFNNKKLWTWILYFGLNALAITMHKSSFVMLVFPFLTFIKLTKKSFFYIAIGLLIGIIFTSQVESYFFYGTSILEYYPNNQSTNYTFAFVFGLLFIMAIVILFLDQLLKKANSTFDKATSKMQLVDKILVDLHPDSETASISFRNNYMLVLPLLIFLIIGLYSNTSVRGYYYSVAPFGSILVSFVFSQKSKLFRLLLLLALILIFSLYFILTFLRRSDCVPYKFFS